MAKKYLLDFILCVITSMLLLAVPAFADIASGTYDNVSWRITDEGELILGNGGTQTMTSRSWRNTNSWPWNRYYNRITSVGISGTIYARGSLEAMFFRNPGGTDDNTTVGYPNCTSVDITGLDVSGVTSTAYMFRGMPNLTTIILPPDFNTSSVTQMFFMFCGCPKLKNLDVHHFQMQNVTNCSAMFWGCEALESINVSSWNTRRLVDTSSMFRLCKNIKTLDVANWTTGNFTNPYGMFLGCESLEYIDVSRWNVSNCTHLNLTFRDCTVLDNLDVSQWNTSKITSLDQTFSGCQRLHALDVTGWNTSKVTTMRSLFRNCQSLQEIDLTHFNTSQVTRLDYMFFNCYKLSEIDLSSFDTRKVTTMNSLFQACKALRQVDISSFNTANVTDMYAMFWDTKLESLDLSHFDTAKVTSMRCMFGRMPLLRQLDVSSFDTTKVTTMGGMFYDDRTLASLDLSNFITPQLTSLVHDNGSRYGMFWGCKKLETLNISGMNCTHVTEMDDMFTGCEKLHEVTLGSQFTFRGNGITAESKQAILPTPLDKEYSGKWIREDEVYGPYTPEALRDNYTAAMSGTWVWEIRPTNTVRFEAPEGASGSMPNDTMYVGIDYEIPECLYRIFNYHLAYWDDGNGNVYPENGIIEDGVYEDGSVITLTAVFEQDNNDASFSNGEADIYLIGGEKIELPNLPGGTGYQVWEETPSGWQLVEQINPAGIIPADGTADVSFTNEYTPGTATVQLIATKTLDGRIPEAGAYQFELLDQDGSVIETAANTETGVVIFGALTFQQAGEFDYTVREVRGEDPAVNYDAHEELIHIKVTQDKEGNLSAEAEYDLDGLRFENETKPGVLTVTKQTDGTSSPDEVFTFQVKITDDYGRSLESVQIVAPER